MIEFNFEEKTGFVSAVITIMVDNQEDYDRVKAFQVTSNIVDSLGTHIKAGDEVFVGDRRPEGGINDGSIRVFSHMSSTGNYIMENGVDWIYAVKVGSKVKPKYTDSCSLGR